MFDVKPGYLEVSKCLMLSLGPSMGQSCSCQVWASRRVKMFDVKPGPLWWFTCLFSGFRA